jgi:hypothetical protein
MSSVISATLAYFASWFQSHHAMQLEILALRHQIAVYQHSVKRPQLRPADRFFWAWFSRLWSGWQHTLEFVQPRTVLAWQKKRFRDYWRRLSQSGKPGRPPISKEVRDLIRDMWYSNPTWGSPRIVGELLKLGITVAQSTVEKYRPRDRKPPSPTWKAFLSNPAQQIVEAFLWDTAPRYLLRDRDAIYGVAFQTRVSNLGLEEVKTAPQSPWQNPYGELVIGSMRRDALDHIIVLNEQHLRGVLRSYVDYDHEWRTHLSLEMDTPESRAVQPPELGAVRKRPEVGGLHHHYERLAA